MSDNLVYFSTLSEAENYFIDTVPFVGYSPSDHTSLFSTVSPAVISNGTVCLLDRINYTATSKVVPRSGSINATLFQNIYDSNSKEGSLLYKEIPTKIGEDAFFEKSALTGIKIPEFITEIAWSAFQDCPNLTSLQVDNNNAIYDSRDNCNAIIKTANNSLVNACVSTVIPNSVTSIADYAFREIRTLTNIAIPTSIESIGNYAFTDCAALENISIPSSCRSVGDAAFRGCAKLTSANIPDNLESIPQELFKDCSKLDNISLPDSIKTIKNEAFYGCASLSSIVIPEGVTKIETRAFAFSNLKTLTLPSTLQTLGDAVFPKTMETVYYDCPNLSSGTIIFSNSIDSITFGTSVIKIPGNFAHSCRITSLVCPENINSIGDRAFVNCQQLSEAFLPGVGTIGRQAFLSCNRLEQVNLGSGIQSIGSECFKNCTALKTVTYSGTPESWMLIDFVNELSNPVYFSTSLTCNNQTTIEVRIPDNLTVTKPFSFINCQNLTKLHIPSHVTSIDSSTFQGTSISEIVWSIADYQQDQADSTKNNSPIQFAQNSLRSITFTEEVNTIPMDFAKDCGLVENIQLADSVQVIKSGAFENCVKLANVILPESLTAMGSGSFAEIGHGVFAGCTSLKSIQFGPNLTLLSEGEFYGSGLESLHIPATLTNIFRDFCFGMCSHLETITVDVNNPVYDSRNNCNGLINTAQNELIRGTSTTVIPDDIVKLGQHCFSGLPITNMIIPSTIISIGSSAFNSCENLTHVEIPNSVTYIGAWAFNNCSKLETITVPEFVTSIGDEAFNGCSSLKEIIMSGSTPCTLDGANHFPSTIQRIIVPSASLESYKTAPGWSNYSDLITNGYQAHTCNSLVITADDVPEGSITTTTIHYIAETTGLDFFGETVQMTYTGDVESDPFEQNLSTTDSVEVLISFTYMGMTAQTTITQGVYCPKKYTINLNDQWRLSTAVSNPDASIYDGVYESNSNYNVNSAYATMYIDLFGYEEFTVYIRSNAESSYDYVMISQPNVSITGSTSYSDTSSIKANTRGSQNTGTAISNYKTVVYTGLDKNTSYRLTVVYRKDSSQHSGTDRGYVLIPKNQ